MHAASSSSSSSALRLPAAFQRLAWSNLVAQSAEQVSLAAAPLVAVFALGAGARETGLLQTAQTLPFLLLSIPLGVWADRRSRRTLMTLAESVRVIAMLCVLLLLMTHALSLPLLAALGFIAATGTVAYNVAAPSLVPSIVPREAYAQANGRLELARSVAYSAGPALGGLLVGWIGAGWAYGCAAGLSALAVALLAGLREPQRAAAPQRHFLLELRDGTRFVLRDALLRPMLATAIFFNLGFFVLQAVYVPYAVHRLGLSASMVGVTLGAYGVGMVCGALAAPAIARRLAFGRVLIIGPSCGLLASLVMVATIVTPSFWLAMLSFFLLGAGPILWVVGSTTLRQAITPERMMGRVSALNSTATYGARPLGALLGAAISARWGMDACLVAAAAAFFVQALIIVMSPAARLAHIPEGVAVAQ
ncbi:MFS transporter [Paraburkholderia nemoris]|uniref:Enterobactin exporter EntS n=1 Tax=Paraburkholderia nemoris TaxID=2793076 RepID=A0ABM8SLM7_9BURK|nr:MULTISPECIES: MFS transporter [Paraburkholderia]MBK3814144.1 MFS transporter [Paraburkholderia aspalathi]MBK5150531.1 MFS transporter [Burkholderia sp. R-69608]CAE6818777.1 Enterobactin exporter EntS [Paraburkholderia nemoris]CAE6945749.1 Enterobactin exporter EntS [Paraburkholderia nemoris]